jgi:hypothetical protein
MSDQKLTAAQKRAATKERKKKAMLENLGADTTPKKTKVKRKRKPMSDEQRAAATERLAKARANRIVKNTTVHPDVLALDDDHPMSYEKVKEWLKYNREHLKAIKGQANSKDRDERSEYQVTAAYVKNISSYIKDKVWNDSRYGQKREKVMERTCVAMAYDKNGQPKRNAGTYYPDIRMVWTRELQEEMNDVR